jgi:hypothetical protein
MLDSTMPMQSALTRVIGKPSCVLGRRGFAADALEGANDGIERLDHCLEGDWLAALAATRLGGSSMEQLPIVYVRGFAGERGIEKAVEDPFYGFNEGSVHVRVGGLGDPSFFQFESPLVRGPR